MTTREIIKEIIKLGYRVEINGHTDPNVHIFTKGSEGFMLTTHILVLICVGTLHGKPYYPEGDSIAIRYVTRKLLQLRNISEGGITINEKKICPLLAIVNGFASTSQTNAAQNVLNLGFECLGEECAWSKTTGIGDNADCIVCNIADSLNSLCRK